MFGGQHDGNIEEEMRNVPNLISETREKNRGGERKRKNHKAHRNRGRPHSFPIAKEIAVLCPCRNARLPGMSEEHQHRVRKERGDNTEADNVVQTRKTVKPKLILQPLRAAYNEYLEESAKPGEQTRQPPVCQKLGRCVAGKLVSHEMPDMVPRPERDKDRDLQKQDRDSRQLPD
jgi:hypothetical protein